MLSYLVSYHADSPLTQPTHVLPHYDGVAFGELDIHSGAAHNGLIIRSDKTTSLHIDINPLTRDYTFLAEIFLHRRQRKINVVIKR